jgi:phosphate transport system substrate-binding protein
MERRLIAERAAAMRARARTRARAAAARTAVGALLALACARAGGIGTGHGDAPAGRLVVTGSSTMAPLMKQIAARFEGLHLGVRIEVQGGGSGRGLADVRAGKADVGMYSRALGDENDLYGFPIARDGICVILNAQNPVSALTEQQLVALFRGEIGRWSGVGGRDAPVVVLNPTESHSSAELFTAHFGIPYSEIAAHRSVGENAARIVAVGADENAVTYVSVGEAERRVQTGARIKLLPMGGVAATSENIRTGNYPLSRPLTLLTRGMPTGLAKSFIEFALSSRVEDLILAHDFVAYAD